MRPISIAFAAALMLGGMSTAYAQDGPGKDRESPGQTQQGQSGGADRGQAETKADRGGGAEKSENRASRSNGGDDRSAQRGEGNEAQGEQRSRDEQGQRAPRQAQEGKQDSEKGSESRQRVSGKDDTDRASGKDEASGKAQRGDRDDDRKAADRREGDQDKARRAQSRDDEDRQRAGTQKDDDAKRAQSRDRQNREDSQSADRKDSDRKSARVELQGDKKERVRNVFREHSGNVRERTDVDIDISVGRALPRDWDYYPVPAAILEVVPEYRGYRYVYVEDKYVIVEPGTYEVVTVIDAGGSGRTTTASRGRCADITLSSSDREYLLKSVQMRNEVDVSGVSIGWRVPDSVELEVFPEPVIKRISGLGSCRYFVVDDRIAVVDPEAHNVVVLVQD